MRYFFFLSLLFAGLYGRSQKIETVHMKEIDCTYDTTAVIKEKVSIKVDAEETKNITFVSGNGKVILINLFTTQCECADCSESFQIAINIDSLVPNEIHYLKRDEVKWVYRNSWIEPKYITNYLGYIKDLGKNTYEIKISEMLNATIIRSINLMVKATQ